MPQQLQPEWLATMPHELLAATQSILDRIERDWPQVAVAEVVNRLGFVGDDKIHLPGEHVLVVTEHSASVAVRLMRFSDADDAEVELARAAWPAPLDAASHDAIAWLVGQVMPARGCA